ncbi:MAG: hypothetical protein V4555_15875, partial [Acidobacteriota bacterium]
LWPDLRDEHELHDLLLSVVALPVGFMAAASGEKSRAMQHWPIYFERLRERGRAFVLLFDGVEAYVAAERLADAKLLWPAVELPDVAEVHAATKEFVLSGTESRPAQTFSARDTAAMQMVQGWLQLLGPTTASELAAMLRV